MESVKRVDGTRSYIIERNTEVWDKLFKSPCPKCGYYDALVYPSPAVWWTAPKELAWKCYKCGEIYGWHNV